MDLLENEIANEAPDLGEKKSLLHKRDIPLHQHQHPANQSTSSTKWCLHLSAIHYNINIILAVLCCAAVEWRLIFIVHRTGIGWKATKLLPLGLQLAIL